MLRYTISYLVFTVIFASNLHAADNAPTVFKMRPIGQVKKSENQTSIVLSKEFEPGLLGLDGYSHIYVFWWFDRNDTPEKRAILQVHPMGNQDNPLTGVFATRSPVRPNLIALTLCKIVAVKDNVIQIEKTDAFDGTPVLDIKPFIPGYDTTEDAKMPDWLERARKQQPQETDSPPAGEHAAAMAKIDRAYDNLKLCQEAKWSTPKNHPDLVPALQAFLVREGLHEAGRNLADGYDDQFKAWLTEAEKVADGLGQAVLSGNLDQADKQFGTLMQSCKQCHAKYRN